ncbi:adenylate/guanylate cyclase domain-containing protein [Salinimonas marina]|uniref:adenylate cyclase n=1 Tax=Salinimonas marina TaxID=2785918 RepID=A0A7S9DZL0_9ALTE|nr:adenylate/guanylate cyclase domain-containing protein [Salinimonas marina]QPG06839.1 adenylate/guanylate cyclase domain-containing protein [Salinimonas marina]
MATSTLRLLWMISAVHVNQTPAPETTISEPTVPENNVCETNASGAGAAGTNPPGTNVSAAHISENHTSEGASTHAIRRLIACASLGVATVLLFYTVYVLLAIPAGAPLFSVMLLHALLFGISAVLATCSISHAFPIARTLFLLAIMSGLAAITMLWQQDIGLQYFLILLMVACTYLFTRQESRARKLAETGCLIVFVGLEAGLLAYNHEQTGPVPLLINLIFGISCLVVLRVIRGRQQQDFQASAPRPWYAHLMPSPSGAASHATRTTREFDNVSVLFADLEGYTRLNTILSEAEVVKLLDALYRQLDTLAASFGIEKIKTNGDQYMAVSGLDRNASGLRSQPDPTLQLCYFAYAAIEVVRQLSCSYGFSLGVRVGIATGPVTGGVIGQHKPCFDVWGQTVNLAARLEQYASTDKVMVCPHTAARIGQNPRSGFKPGPPTLLRNQYPAHSLHKSSHCFV